MMAGVTQCFEFGMADNVNFANSVAEILPFCTVYPTELPNCCEEENEMRVTLGNQLK